ncbi:amidohydrolase [Agrococcus jejuensis]|uniref:Amidohydrolase 3 domain-containing protein n=1 Tax=Agrococcus jejuensis TaxID=399736 RepID=A0A1G8CWX3_9MICO|nr:amidohydrolase family protein [Agrococcus jejuensis]SDH49952.1 hypothetical protein SAMN04489720_1439 [Agrococcus jejuensis]
MTDLVVQGARILAPEPIEHASVAVRGGRIVGIGTAGEMRALVGADADVLDARGATLTPGLIDSHAHPVNVTTLARGIDLGAVRTWDDLAVALHAEAARVQRIGGDAWVRAWNLDYAVFADRPMSAAAIDDLVLGLPACVMLFDCHTAIASSAALRIAGVRGAERFADAAQIVVDADGRPTGELREPSAYARVLDHAPGLRPDEARAAVLDTLHAFRRSGVTSVVVMDGDRSRHDLYDELDATASGLPVRIMTALLHGQHFDDDDVDDVIAQRDRHGSRWSGGLIKLFHDGVIDTGTAWLYEADTRGDGLAPLWPDPARYADVVQRYAEAGFQIATHAIGDRAVGEVVTAYERAGVTAVSGAPHRIEHLETMTDVDLARIARAGIGVSMQPLHMQWRAADHSDSWADRLGGERSARGWRAKDVLRAGATLALGSDWPVAQLDARIGMAWARMRGHVDGDRGHVFEPEQRLTGAEVLHGYTTAGATLMGDASLGRIAVGAKADLALWADDPTRVSPQDLLDLAVVATVVDGQLLEHGAPTP